MNNNPNWDEALREIHRYQEDIWRLTRENQRLSRVEQALQPFMRRWMDNPEASTYLWTLVQEYEPELPFSGRRQEMLDAVTALETALSASPEAQPAIRSLTSERAALAALAERLKQADPKWQERSEEELRRVISTLCHFIWYKQLRPGEHLWTIPVDHQRDFDIILSDAVDELIAWREAAVALRGETGDGKVTEQAQAEDRRATDEEAESYLEWLREGGNDDVAAAIAVLLAELSRLSRELDAQIQESRRLLADRDAFWLRVESLSRVEQALRDAAEMLWVVLANVSGGDWNKQSPEWQEAAARWRDNYFAALSASAEAQPEEGR